jgi:hypothetical protein
MQFTDLENRDGARFSWNVLPTDRVSAQRMSVPIGCLYSPLKPLNGLAIVKYKPLNCINSACGAMLNPYWYVHDIFLSASNPSAAATPNAQFLHLSFSPRAYVTAP